MAPSAPSSANASPPAARGCWPRRGPSRAELADEVRLLKKTVHDLHAAVNDRLSTRRDRPSEHVRELRADVAALQAGLAALAGPAPGAATSAFAPASTSTSTSTSTPKPTSARSPATRPPAPGPGAPSTPRSAAPKDG